MNTLATLALLGWTPLVLGSFMVLPARRATIAAFVIGWMFLPVAEFRIPGFPNWDKTAATTLGVFLGMVLLDRGRLGRRPFGWVDLPMLIWCLCPLATSIANGLGAYDGFSQTLRQILTWGLPYLIGRAYFSTWSGLRELAVGCVLGGLVYVPLCLWEIRMSPQLHAIVYGFHQHDFSQTIREGGFRPTVFMRHGLMVGMWMSMTTLVALTLWRYGKVQRLGPLPMGLAVLALLLTTILCRSMGATLLLAAGAGIYWVLPRLRRPLPLLALLVVPLVYMGVRVPGLWSGEGLLDLAGSVSEERRISLQYRLDSEDLLIGHSLQQPFFGWGGFGRNNTMILDEEYIVVIVDGLWILTLSQLGLFGLVALTLSMLGPVLSFVRRFPPQVWTHPSVAAAGSLTLVLALWMIDNLFNAMINPVYVLVAGGLPLLRLPRPGGRPQTATRLASQSAATVFFTSSLPAPGPSERTP